MIENITLRDKPCSVNNLRQPTHVSIIIIWCDIGVHCTRPPSVSLVDNRHEKCMINLLDSRWVYYLYHLYDISIVCIAFGSVDRSKKVWQHWVHFWFNEFGRDGSYNNVTTGVSDVTWYVWQIDGDGRRRLLHRRTGVAGVYQQVEHFGCVVGQSLL